MNRRSFFSKLALATAGFAILPAATTYKRTWKTLPGFNCNVAEILRTSEFPYTRGYQFWWNDIRHDFIKDLESGLWRNDVSYKQGGIVRVSTELVYGFCENNNLGASL